MPDVDSPYPYRDEDEVRLQETREARGGFVCPLCGRPDSRGKAVHDRTTHAGVEQPDLSRHPVDVAQDDPLVRKLAEMQEEARRRESERILAGLDLDDPRHANAVADAIVRYRGGSYVPLSDRYPWIDGARPRGRDILHLAPDEAEHGHRFRIAFTSALSAALSTDERPEPHDWRDADWWGEAREVTIRAFDLPTALRIASALPLTTWYPDEELLPPTPDAPQYGEAAPIDWVAQIIVSALHSAAAGETVDPTAIAEQIRSQAATENDLAYIDEGTVAAIEGAEDVTLRLAQEESRLNAIRVELQSADSSTTAEEYRQHLQAIAVLVGPATDLVPADTTSEQEEA